MECVECKKALGEMNDYRPRVVKADLGSYFAMPRRLWRLEGKGGTKAYLDDKTVLCGGCFDRRQQGSKQAQPAG